MRIYLAASFARREEMQERAATLRAMGYVVTSRWIDGGHEAENGISAADPNHVGFANEDLQDIEDAHVLIAFTEPPNTRFGRGGRHVEMGFALGIGNIVIVVGHRENIFTILPDIIFIEDFSEIEGALKEANRRRFRKPVGDLTGIQRAKEMEELKDEPRGKAERAGEVARKLYGR